MISNSFINNIVKPELKSMRGKRYVRLIVISALFSIAIIASGIAKSFDKILNEKMNSDPYIKCIDVERKSEIAKKTLLDEEEARRFAFIFDENNKVVGKTNDALKFDIEAVETASFIYETFQTHEKLKLSDSIFTKKQIKGMVIEEDNEFYKNFKTTNQFLTNNKFKNSSMSLILTEKFLADFYKKEDIEASIELIKKIPFLYVIKNNKKIPIPISAVVKKLNYNCSFAITKEFRNADQSKFNLSNYNDRLTLFVPDNFDVNKIPEDLNKLVTEGNSINDICFQPGELYTTNNLNLKIPDGMFKVYDVVFTENDESNPIQADYISFFLNSDDINKIESLSDELFKRYGVEFDNSRIETKKNYLIFNKILQILTTILVLFSCIAIIIFTTNSVISHLDSNKKSLGTLKAFGLSNTRIVQLYSLISFMLIIISFFIALLFAQLIGNNVLSELLRLVPGNLRGKFELADAEFLFIMVITPVFYILYKIFRYLHNKTPGDLIYERK